MTLLERISTNPALFVIGCLVWVPIAICVIALIHWAVAGEIDVVLMILGIGACVALGYFTTNPPHPLMAPVLFFAVFATLVLFPFARRALHEREHLRLDAEQAEGAYAILRRSPMNLGARMKLARVLFVRGMAGHAIRVAEAALKGMPRQQFLDDHREVEKWAWQVRDPAHYRPLPCLHCRTMNPPGEIFCTHCGGPFLLDQLRGAWSAGGLGRKLIAAWILAVFAFVGIPSSALLASPLLAIGLIVAQVAAGAAVLVTALRDRKEPA